MVMNTVLIGVFVYIFAQLLAGILVSRRIKNEADYLLGSARRLASARPARCMRRASATLRQIHLGT
jgi:hypothetical protein